MTPHYISCADLDLPVPCCLSCHDDEEDGYGELMEHSPPRSANGRESGAIFITCCAVWSALESRDDLRALAAHALRAKRRG